MTNSVVGTGVSGGLTTRGRPSQKGDSQCWAAKKDTHTESLDSGEVFQYEQSGVASPGARSSEDVTTTDASNVVAAHADSGVAGSINGTVTDPGASSSDLVGSAPPSSNPGRPAIGALPKVSLGHGGPLPTSASFLLPASTASE